MKACCNNHPWSHNARGTWCKKKVTTQSRNHVILLKTWRVRVQLRSQKQGLQTRLTSLHAPLQSPTSKFGNDLSKNRLSCFNVSFMHLPVSLFWQQLPCLLVSLLPVCCPFWRMQHKTPVTQCRCAIEINIIFIHMFPDWWYYPEDTR